MRTKLQLVQQDTVSLSWTVMDCGGGKYFTEVCYTNSNVTNFSVFVVKLNFMCFHSLNSGLLFTVQTPVSTLCLFHVMRTGFLVL